jgi:REP element-mobilizing transposase RayT
MQDPIAFFLTWSTYGTWLPGDARGWVEYQRGIQLPNPILELECSARMAEDACILGPRQRQRVEQQVAETCAYRGWRLHAVNCRTNHVHVVLSASANPKSIREQLKAWCTRRLKELEAECGVPETERRVQRWAERGSIRRVFSDDDLAVVVDYVVNQQDNPKRFDR